MNAFRPSALLSAGAAVADITPAGSVFLYGYPHVRRFSSGVHDPLQCAALFLQSGEERALILSNDVICVTKSFVSNVRRRIHEKTGIAESAVLISATHTHSGPVITNYLSNSADSVVPKADVRYLEFLADQMVAASCAAVKAAVPAEVGLAVAKAYGVGCNRHDPAGPSDPEVPVLIARSLVDHKPLACMVVYGMHPTVLHEDSTLISADFPHYTRAFLQQSALPASCPVIYHNGASGNQSPRHMTRANTFAEAKRLGELLGESIAAVIPTITYRQEADLHHKQQLLPLIARTFPSVGEAVGIVAQKKLHFEQLKTQGAPRQAVRTAECDVFGAEETATLAHAAADGRLTAAVAGSSPVEIQVIEVGPWRFIAWPGEYFVEYALELKSRLPNTYLITIANGEVQGYIVTEAAAAQRVYESANAIFAPQNGPHMVEATVALALAKT